MAPAVTVVTLNTSLVRGTTAKFNGELTDMNDQAAIDCYFQYRITGAADWSDTSANKEELTAVGEFSYSITGLTENESYEVRAVAEWDDGGTQNAYGDTETFNAFWVREGSREDFERGILDGVDILDGELVKKLTPESYLSFDGEDDYVDVGVSALLNPGAEFTIMAWVVWDGTWFRLLSEDINDSNKKYFASVLSTGKIQFFHHINRSDNYTVNSSYAVLTEGELCQVAIVRTAARTLMYFQGLNIATDVDTINSSSGYNSPDRVDIGRWRTTYSSSDLFKIKAWQRALSAAEVWEHYLNPWASMGADAKLWYKIDEDTGTSLTDSSGNSYTGTIYGATWDSQAVETSGNRQKPYKITNTDSEITWTATTPADTTLAIEAQVKGTTAITDEAVGTYSWFNRLYFTGSDSWIDLGNTLYLTDNHPFTAEGCIIFDSFSSRDMLLCRNNAVKSGSSYTWLLGTKDGTKMGAYDGESWREINYSFVLNTVYHLAFSYDGTDMVFYINGELVGAYEGWTFSDLETGRNTQIGGYDGSLGDVHGKKWNVRFWDYARTQQQIDDNKHVYIRESQAGLLLNVPMVEGEGSIVYDKSGNGYNGTIIGAPWEVNNYSLNYWPANTPVIKLNGVETTDFALKNDRRKIIFDDWLPNPDEPAITASYTAVDDPQDDEPEIQELDLDDPEGGTFKLGDGTTWTDDIAYDATQATIQTALEGLYGAGNVEVKDLSVLYVLDFDGSNDYAVIPYDASLNIGTSDFTISFWEYPDATGGNNYVRLSRGGTGSSFYFYDNSGYRLRINGSDVFNELDTIPTGEWSMITIVRDDDTITIYRNKTSLGSYTGWGSADIDDGTNDWTIGREAGGSRYFNGKLDDLVFYDRALSLSEISDLFDRTYSSSNLIGHWPMNEGEGTTVYDESTNNNDGTIKGASWDLLTVDKFQITFAPSVGDSGLVADFTELT